MHACLQAAPCILAVGHSCRDTSAREQGRLTLWSIKDPLQPVNSFSTPAGVTSIAWSKRAPNHIAVGMHSGIVAVYDARQQVMLCSAYAYILLLRDCGNIQSVLDGIPAA